jgi:hypothetical protein
MPRKKMVRLPASEDRIKKVRAKKQTPLLFFSHPEVNQKKKKNK